MKWKNALKQTIDHLIWIFPLLITSFCSDTLHAQAPAIEWQNSIGGTSNEELRSITINPDGSYVLAGYSNSGISGDKSEMNMGIATTTDYWIIKFSPSGSII